MASMAASTQIARQWGIFQTLHQRQQGMTASRLARQFGVSKNTVIRDLETLSAAGFTMEHTEDGNRYVHRLADGVRKIAQIRPTELELLALYAARTQLAPLVGTPLFGDIMSLMHKIHGMIQPSNKGVLEAMSEFFMDHPRGVKSYRQHEEIIDDLVDAILRRRVCVIEYTRPRHEASKTHELRPLRMFFSNGGLYLVGLLGRHKYVSTLAVERMGSVNVTRRTFKIPHGLDLKARFRSRFGLIEDGKPQLVEIIFSPRAAPYVRERVWHPDQMIEDLSDGGARWKARVQGKYEVVTWVLSWAEQAELVRPVAWRREIRERLAGGLERYDIA